MDMLAPVQIAQIVVAASVSYALYITFFQPKAVEKPRSRSVYASKQTVRQRSERWAA